MEDKINKAPNEKEELKSSKKFSFKSIEKLIFDSSKQHGQSISRTTGHKKNRLSKKDRNKIKTGKMTTSQIQIKKLKSWANSF